MKLVVLKIVIIEPQLLGITIIRIFGVRLKSIKGKAVCITNG